MVEPRDSRIIFLFSWLVTSFELLWTFSWGKRTIKLQTGLYLGRSNYPAWPKSCLEPFSRRRRFSKLHLSPLSTLAILRKIICSIRKECSAFCRSDFLYFPIFLADTLMEGINVKQKERMFSDKLLLISSGLFTSCLDYDNAPNKSLGILFLKTNLSSALSCLKFSVVIHPLLDKIQTLHDLALRVTSSAKSFLTNTRLSSPPPIPSVPLLPLSSASSSSTQLILQDLVSTAHPGSFSWAPHNRLAYFTDLFGLGQVAL